MLRIQDQDHLSGKVLGDLPPTDLQHHYAGSARCTSFTVPEMASEHARVRWSTLPLACERLEDLNTEEGCANACGAILSKMMLPHLDRQVMPSCASGRGRLERSEVGSKCRPLAFFVCRWVGWPVGHPRRDLDELVDGLNRSNTTFARPVW